MKIFKSVSDPAVAALLLNGQVGIVPCDTVYGIVCLAALPEKVAQLHILKQRAGKLGTIIAASVQQLIDMGIDKTELSAAAAYWPNPLSVVVTASPHLAYLHQDIGSLAVRIPKNDALLALLQKTGPLATTSANLADQPTVGTLQEAMVIFGEKVTFYVDGGDFSNAPASTIIRIVNHQVEVLRQGAYKL